MRMVTHGLLRQVRVAVGKVGDIGRGAVRHSLLGRRFEACGEGSWSQNRSSLPTWKENDGKTMNEQGGDEMKSDTEKMQQAAEIRQGVRQEEDVNVMAMG